MSMECPNPKPKRINNRLHGNAEEMFIANIINNDNNNLDFIKVISQGSVYVTVI